MKSIDKMRGMVNLFNCCSEDFNQHYTMCQLEKIYDAYWASQWDIAPDRWTARQVKEALCGVVPQWDEHGNNPVYTMEMVAAN